MNRRLPIALVATASAVYLLRPDARSWRELAGPGITTAIARDGADAVLATAARAVLWLVLAWLLTALIVLAASALPGRLGGWAKGLSRAIAPAATRRALALAVGVGIAAGPALVGAVTAQAGAPARAQAPTWPLSGPQWPISPDAPASTDAATDAAPSSAARTVVVATGDTLWSIAADQLTRAAGPGEPDPADIAASWPQWHRVNADTIGPDPNRILPGAVLRTPDGL